MNAQHSGWGRPRHQALASNAGEARTRLDRELELACALPRSFGQRQRLGEELQRLERLQLLAQLWPSQWRRCTADCREALALWLFGVALGVAGLGMPEAALALLDALPGIGGGAQGRLQLLQSLIADDDGLALRPAQGGGR